MPNEPSLDPQRTVDHIPAAEASSLVDGATTPHAPAPPADAPRIPGYGITAEIATGGMGRVYAGQDLTLDRAVAIKTLLPGADRERFVVEAKITARLPHPGIPPVHALGTLEDGSPFLAMKLIQGRTLAELLRERPTPLHELPRFVQIFEQIAQAVGFAHSRGVIHRDLKPLNVMVGAFGEVQVMDWGLAKDLTSPERESGASASAENVEHTAAGSVLGTPGFMAPEQARGEAVDARADVFALGATLAVILTGKPAVVGTTVRETIERAARGDLDDVRERLTNSGADAELIGVAVRCLSAKAEDRPADGRAVAAEVAAYRAGVEARLKQAEAERAEAQVRAVEQGKRRRVIQVAGGIIVFILLVGLGVSLWQMFRAIHAEGESRTNAIHANRNAQRAGEKAEEARQERDAKAKALEAEKKARQQAFAALRSMTTNVVERKFSQGSVLTDDDKAFLRGIIAQFDAFAAIQEDDADSRAIQAEGRFRVATLRHKLGELKEAEQNYDDSAALLQQLVSESPANPRARSLLAHCYDHREMLLAATGRQKEAEKDADAALALLKQVAAEFPDRPEYRDELAGVHLNRANLQLAIGNFEAAKEDHDAALAIQKRLLAKYPDRPELLHGLALNYTNRAAVLRAMKRLKEAEADYDQALVMYKQLSAKYPDRPDYRYDMAACHGNRGSLLQQMGRLKEAEQAMDAGLAISRELAAQFPSRPDFRVDLANGHRNRGSLLHHLDRIKEAEQDYDTAMTLYTRLAADFPTRPEFRVELAKIHESRGGLMRGTHGIKEAARELNAALTHSKQLAAAFPDRSDLSNAAARACYNLALFSEHEQKDLVTAKRLLLEGLPYHQAALKAMPNNEDYRWHYHLHLGVLTVVHAELLERDEAVRTAMIRHDLPWGEAEGASSAARFMSWCIPHMAELEKLNDQQRKAEAQFYTDRALKFLRETLDKGFKGKEAAALRSDKEFSSLWQNPDFKKLLAEMEAKGK